MPGITAVKSAFGLLVGQPQSIQSLTVNDSLWRGFHLESNQGCVMFFLSKLLSFSANMRIALFCAITSTNKPAEMKLELHARPGNLQNLHVNI